MTSNNKSQARHWVFTINNPTPEDFEILMKLETQCKYGAWQLEHGEKEETLHVQGYIGFENRIRFGAMKEKLPRSHLEVAASPSKAYDYCIKDDTRINSLFKGNRPAESQAGLKSNQWKVFQEYTKTHDWDECVEEFPHLLKDEGAMRKIFERKFKKNEAPSKKIVCFWGPPDTGKSSTVLKLLEGVDYFKQDNGKWWDGYNYEETVFIDDMEPGRFTRSIFLSLLDERQFVRGEIKGGSALIRATTIYITSNYDPQLWFEKQEKKNMGEAVCRRMEIWHCTENSVPERQRQQGGNTVPPAVKLTQATLLAALKPVSDEEKPSTSPQLLATESSLSDTTPEEDDDTSSTLTAETTDSDLSDYELMQRHNAFADLSPLIENEPTKPIGTLDYTGHNKGDGRGKPTGRTYLSRGRTKSPRGSGRNGAPRKRQYSDMDGHKFLNWWKKTKD